MGIPLNHEVKKILIGAVATITTAAILAGAAGTYLGRRVTRQQAEELPPIRGPIPQEEVQTRLNTRRMASLDLALPLIGNNPADHGIAGLDLAGYNPVNAHHAEIIHLPLPRANNPVAGRQVHIPEITNFFDDSFLFTPAQASSSSGASLSAQREIYTAVANLANQHIQMDLHSRKKGDRSIGRAAAANRAWASAIKYFTPEEVAKKEAFVGKFVKSYRETKKSIAKEGVSPVLNEKLQMLKNEFENHINHLSEEKAGLQKELDRVKTDSKSTPDNIQWLQSQIAKKSELIASEVALGTEYYKVIDALIESGDEDCINGAYFNDAVASLFETLGTEKSAMVKEAFGELVLSLEDTKVQPIDSMWHGSDDAMPAIVPGSDTMNEVSREIGQGVQELKQKAEEVVTMAANTVAGHLENNSNLPREIAADPLSPWTDPTDAFVPSSNFEGSGVKGTAAKIYNAFVEFFKRAAEPSDSSSSDWSSSSSSDDTTPTLSSSTLDAAAGMTEKTHISDATSYIDPSVYEKYKL
jgi:hypothetical protein